MEEITGRNTGPESVHLYECLHYDSATDTTDLPLRPHNHNFSQVMLVRKGVCRVLRNGVTLRVSQGEAIYIAPLIIHSVESDDGAPIVIDSVKFRSSRLQAVPQTVRALRSLPVNASQAMLHSIIGADEVKAFRIHHIIDEIIAEDAKRRYAYAQQIHALLYMLIIAMVRFWHQKSEEFPQQPDAERDPILDIPAYIEKHIAEPLRVEQLAEHCGLSYPWFASRFKAYFGISCKQCIQRLRIDAAEQYLIFTEMDLEEISRQTGYHDASHLVKDFRLLNGNTPGQYREICRRQTGIKPET